MSTMPLNLVLVRHGESEGNKVKKIYKNNEGDPHTKEFLNRHSSEFRLTDNGRQQAIVTGKWIRENVGETFDFYAVSEYVRAMETAGLLGLPNARWQRDIDLRERDYGFADLMHPEQYQIEFGDMERYKKNSLIDPIPGGGESIASMRLRSWRIFNRLRRRIPDGSAILCSHGEFILGCMFDIEHILMDKFLEMRESKDPFTKIHQCQVIQYSRANPFNGAESNCYTWKRSVCPSSMNLSSNVWMPILRDKYTNEELIEEALKYPRYVS